MKCNTQRVVEHRVKKKLALIDAAGGKCQLCGYNFFAGALQFHHCDPAEKNFELSSFRTLAYDRLLQEARKCVLLCATCHAEVEGGVASIGELKSLIGGDFILEVQIKGRRSHKASHPRSE